MVYPGVHIAKHNIRFGAFPCLKHFHTKVRAPNPPSNQGRIKDHRFHDDGFCKDELMQKILQYFMDITQEEMPESAHEMSKKHIPYVEVDMEERAST